MKVWTMLAVAGAMMWASAGTAATSVFDFRGTCTDCAGFGIGRLTLQDYVYGTQITNSNFVSFSYSGSNLYRAFTITQANALSVTGSIGSSQPGPQTTAFASGNDYFRSETNGSWQLGNNNVADYGTNGTYTLAAAAPAAPEPAAWALLVGGFGIAGLTLRRRARVTARIRLA